MRMPECGLIAEYRIGDWAIRNQSAIRNQIRNPQSAIRNQLRIPHSAIRIDFSGP
jgi:hypothetical protein